MIGQRFAETEVSQHDGSRVRVGRHHRYATLLLVTHDGCRACDQLRVAAADRADALAWWGARVVATADPDGALRARLQLAPGQAAVAVIDRFGTVWELQAASDDGHEGLPDVDGLEESAKFLGTLCPECGVPDDPYTGRWAVV